MLGIEKSQVRDGKVLCDISGTHAICLMFPLYIIAVAEVMDLKVQAQVAANSQQAPVRT